MRTVRDIMTKPVIVICSATTVENAILLMRAKRVRSLIVEPDQEGGAYGILTEKDIVFKVIALGIDPGMVHISDIMRQPCIHVPVEATVREAAQILADAGIHRAPVIGHNQLLGIVSVTDILCKGQSDAPPRDELAKHIQEVLKNSRIIDDEEAQMRHDCDIAWQVLEELKRDTHATI